MRSDQIDRILESEVSDPFGAIDWTRLHYVQSYRLQNRAADRWARGFELVRHSLETQERVFRMAEQLAAMGIPGNGLPVFEVLIAADQLTSTARRLDLQRACAETRPSLWAADSAPPGPMSDSRAADPDMVSAYVGYLAANALTGDARSRTVEADAARAVETVDSLRDAVAGARLPFGDFLSLPKERAASGRGGQRAVAFLSHGALDDRDLLARMYRRSAREAAPSLIVLCDTNPLQRFLGSKPVSIDRLVAELRSDGFEPILIDSRDPAAFAWAIFELECRAPAMDAAPCTCHPAKQATPCALAVAAPVPEDAGESWRLLSSANPAAVVNPRAPITNF